MRAVAVGACSCTPSGWARAQRAHYTAQCNNPPQPSQTAMPSSTLHSAEELCGTLRVNGQGIKEDARFLHRALDAMWHGMFWCLGATRW